jgi:hypothetical protein
LARTWESSAWMSERPDRRRPEAARTMTDVTAAALSQPVDDEVLNGGVSQTFAAVASTRIRPCHGRSCVTVRGAVRAATSRRGSSHGPSQLDRRRTRCSRSRCLLTAAATTFRGPSPRCRTARHRSRRSRKHGRTPVLMLVLSTATHPSVPPLVSPESPTTSGTRWTGIPMNRS